MMIQESINSGIVIPVVLFVIGLIVIFIADFSHFNLATFGESRTKILTSKIEWSANLPLIGLAALIIGFGIFSFDSWVTLLTNAVKIIIGS